MANNSNFDQIKQKIIAFAEAMQLYDTALINTKQIYNFSSDLDSFYVCYEGVFELIRKRPSAYKYREDLVATLVTSLAPTQGTIKYRTYVAHYLEEKNRRQEPLTKEFLRFVKTIQKDSDLIFNCATDSPEKMYTADMGIMGLYDSLVLIGREFEKSLYDLQNSIIQAVRDLNNQEAFNDWLSKNPDMQILMKAIHSNLKLSQFKDMEMGFPRIRSNSRRVVEPITPTVEECSSTILDLCKNNNTTPLVTSKQAFDVLNRRRLPILEFFKNIIEWFLSKLYPATERLKKTTMTKTTEASRATAS